MIWTVILSSNNVGMNLVVAMRSKWIDKRCVVGLFCFFQENLILLCRENFMSFKDKTIGPLRILGVVVIPQI